MRIWLDVITPKQARLMSCIAKRVGAEYLITAKGYEDTIGVLEGEGIDFRIVGRYHPGDRYGKLVSYAERIVELASLVRKFKPDFLISLSSPEAVRVAFGLGIRAISLNDTPHAYHVGRLSLPLSWKVIHPLVIPKELLVGLGADPPSLVPYDGVDEVAWIRERVRNLVKVRKYVVFIRPEEVGASYMLDTRTRSLALEAIEPALEMGAEVIVKPRYGWQEREIAKRYGEEVRIARGVVDTPRLFGEVTLVVTGGGTMAREAALLGTPAISAFPLDVKIHVNDYLTERGFPLFRVKDPGSLRDLVYKILQDPDSYVADTSKLIQDLEDPVSKVQELLEGG